MSAAFVDVLVVTSTPEELGGVLALGDDGEAGWSKRKAEDGSTYHVREFENARGKTFVMAATWAGAEDIASDMPFDDMEGRETANRLAQLIQELAPSWLAFPGLCTSFSDIGGSRIPLRIIFWPAHLAMVRRANRINFRSRIRKTEPNLWTRIHSLGSVRCCWIPSPIP